MAIANNQVFTTYPNGVFLNALPQFYNSTPTNNPMGFTPATDSSGNSISPTDLIGQGSKFLNGGSGGSILTGAKNYINQWGANTFGFSPSALPTYGGIGPGALPWQQPGMVANGSMVGSPGVVAGGPTFTGIAGGALSGAGVGGLVAGLTGGNSTAGSIGGGLASGIAAWAGLSSIGTMGVGAIAGLAAGKLFKKKPSDKTMAGGVSLESGEVNKYYAQQESSTGKKYDDNNAKMRDAVESGSARFVKYLKDNGAVLKDNNPDRTDEMVFVIGGRDGFRLFEYERGANVRDDSPRTAVEQAKGYKNYGSDFAAYSNGIKQTIMDRYEIPEELKKQLEGTDFQDISAWDAQAQSNSSAGYMTGVPRQDQVIGAREDTGKETFTQFLNKYNTRYTNGT